MNLWLKSIGAADKPIANKWYDHGSEEGEFRWHVRMSEAYNGSGILKSDLLLYLAFIEGVESRHVCGVARVSGNEGEWAPRHAGDQWPWLRHTTPLLVVPLAAQGPVLGEIGVGEPPFGGYKEIDAGAFGLAVRLLARNALPAELDKLVPDP